MFRERKPVSKEIPGKAETETDRDRHTDRHTDTRGFPLSGKQSRRVGRKGVEGRKGGKEGQGN